mgnify:CR=1 FL=1
MESGFHPLSLMGRDMQRVEAGAFIIKPITYAQHQIVGFMEIFEIVADM